jgi:DNA-directed RNA polymerase specialized sigma24 family protein
MNIPNLPGPSAYDNDFDVDKMLEDHDAFIVALARKNVPYNVTSPELLDLDIDELAQNTRIKLWIASQKKRITCLKAYIRCIVRSQSVNMVREHKPVLPLPTDEDDELYQGNLLIILGEGMQDPLAELEQDEMIAEYITKTVDEVLKLPPRQQLSMICSLKEELDDLLLLVNAFKDRGVDIEIVNCPEEQEEIQRYRASRSVARKKMRSLKKDKYAQE